MDKNVVDGAILGTCDCFSLMMGKEAKATEPIPVTLENVPKSDVTAVIGFAGDVNGWVAARMSDAVIGGIVESMLSIPKEEATDFINDAAGEFINIVVGSVKRMLSESQKAITISIPSIVVGSDHDLSPLSNSEYVTISFISDLGEFNIDICLKL